MPKMDGITATRRIRHLSPSTAVIALTSYPDSGLFAQAMEAGAVSCLSKDVAIDQLAEVIRRAHSQKSAECASLDKEK